MDTKIAIIMLLVALGAAAAQAAFADTANIVNNIYTSATTGGNSIAGASSSANVSNGTATVEIHIEQIVNGVKEAPIDLTTSSGSGVSVSVKSVITAHGSMTAATTTISSGTGTATSAPISAGMTTTNEVQMNVFESIRTFFNDLFGPLFNVFRFKP